MTVIDGRIGLAIAVHVSLGDPRYISLAVAINVSRRNPRLYSFRMGRSRTFAVRCTILIHIGGRAAGVSAGAALDGCVRPVIGRRLVSVQSLARRLGTLLLTRRHSLIVRHFPDTHRLVLTLAAGLPSSQVPRSLDLLARCRIAKHRMAYRRLARRS